MSEPEQNQKSENPHASFSDDKRIIERLARRIIGPSPNSIALDFNTWLEMLNKTMEAIEAVWPDIEKHFRQKFEDEAKPASQSESTIWDSFSALDATWRDYMRTFKTQPINEWAGMDPQKMTASKSPQTTDTISNKINALANALHEVEKTVEVGQARYKTQSDDTKESILKALSVLAFEARKEHQPLQACQNPFEPKITDNRREPEAEVKFYQDKDGGCYMSIGRVDDEAE
jgi:hypothetical protein